MKNKILLSVLLMVLLVSSSCSRDQSLDPRPLRIEGQFMRLDITNDRMDFNNLSTTYFGGTLSNPTNNVAKYEMYVRRTDAGGTITGDYVLMTTITSFPYELKITPQMVADAVGISVDQLQEGDFYRFYCYSYDNAGNRISYRELSRNVATETTLKQAYRFNTILTTNLDPNPDFTNYTP